MRFLFFKDSIFVIIVVAITLAASCKNDSKLERLDLDKLTIEESDSVRKLLELSKVFLEKKQYDDAIANLTIIINNFGTYPEFIEAQDLIDQAQNGADMNAISNSNDLKELQSIKEGSSDPDVRNAADQKMGEVIANSNDPNQLEEYLIQPGFKKFEEDAKNRLGSLNEISQDQQYQEAMAANSAKKWKDYLQDYPNDPRRKDIENTIIQLEVNDIFSGDHGEMPSFDRISDVSMEVSSVEVKNDTRYTLTLRYSGIDIKKVVIPAGNTMNVDLKSGFYRVTASVDAYNVRNYAGTETLNGEYEVVYYISNH